MTVFGGLPYEEKLTHAKENIWDVGIQFTAIVQTRIPRQNIAS